MQDKLDKPEGQQMQRNKYKKKGTGYFLSKKGAWK